jgi:cyclic pyranopterin monophosphate synthase
MGLTHVDDEGRARMVDVSGKPVTTRTAIASGFVRMSSATLHTIKSTKNPKGDPLETARLAGVMAAKRTSELIPLCHPLPLNFVNVEVDLQENGIHIKATAVTDSKTGVEMEALTAVSVAALTLYDMCKAIDKGMIIGEIRLDSKTGGKSGDYIRPAQD